MSTNLKDKLTTTSPERVPVNAIEVGRRHRKDLGDIAGLARSMAEIGLLQPIGITPENRLVFGERRLRAAQELGWTEILVIRIHIESIVLGEYSENELRKDFTPSERVAIGRTVEEHLGARQGRRTDLGKDSSDPDELPENSPEVEPGKETREIAAEKAGFASEWSYRQAKKVVDEAAPEVVQAMDASEVSISDAAAVADQPEEIQAQAVEAVRNREARTLREAAKRIDRFKEMRAALGRVIRLADDEKAEQGGRSHRYYDALKESLETTYNYVDRWRNAR